MAQQDEFLATVGHELRNPLSPIFMQAQYLLGVARQQGGEALSRPWLVSQLEGFCRRLSRFLETLNRLMDISRMDAGQLALELEPLDLAEIVREVATGAERELAAARCDLRLDMPARALGSWDRLRLEQIVGNLLSNAIRYGAGKPITIRLRERADRVELTIEDQGIGIAEQDQERIFDRFERAGKTRSSGGFGIGLWTVRQCCRAMGGEVAVRSRSNLGSSFSVTLPRQVEKAGSQ